LINSNIFSSPEIEYLFKIIVGFLVGALIGLERERARLASTREKLKSLPGVRSFGLLSLYGTIVSHMAIIISEQGYAVLEVFMLITFTVIILIVMAMYIYQRIKILGRTGITTYIVMGLDLGLGVLVGINRILEAIATSVLVTLILAAKPSIERFVKGVSYRELLSGLELGLLVFVLGPVFLLRPVIIFGLDLSKLYFLFILILVLSFISYIGVKVKGSEALKYIAFLGGLVNSEAATVNIASILDSQELHDNILKKAMKKNLYIIVSAMLIRNIIIVSILSYTILPLNQFILLTGTIILASTPILLVSYFSWFYEEQLSIKSVSVKIENPLSFKTALKVVLIYTAIFAASYMFTTVLGTKAAYLISVVGGFVNAGATILTLFALSGLNIIFNINELIISIILIKIMAIWNKLLYIRAAVKKEVLKKAGFEAVMLSSLPLLAVIIIIIILTQHIYLGM